MTVLSIFRVGFRLVAKDFRYSSGEYSAVVR